MSAFAEASTASAEDVDRRQKNWSNLAAHAALRGYQLWRTDAADGPQRFVIAKWGMVRVLADLAEVDRFLEQAGARD